MIKSIKKKENERVKKKEGAMEKKEEVRRRKKNPTYFTNHMNSEGGESYPELF
jgi:hypothetical protein